MAKNNPKANPVWGVQRSKPACLCTDGLTYSNECCEGYLWNQGISRTQGTNPRLQNLLTTQVRAGGIASVFILWQDNANNESGKIIWAN